MTPSYIRSTVVPERIANYDPAAKIMTCLRNPIERAFSHYWHEKKKKRFDYDFSEALENYDLFGAWVETGMYFERLRPFWEAFGEEQVLCQWFDDLSTNPKLFFDEAAAFMGMSSDPAPRELNQKINAAGVARSGTSLSLRALAGNVLDRLHVKGSVREAEQKISQLRGGRLRGQEQLSDVPRHVREDVWHSLEGDVQKLERALNVNLDGWRRAVG